MASSIHMTPQRKKFSHGKSFNESNLYPGNRGIAHQNQTLPQIAINSEQDMENNEKTETGKQPTFLKDQHKVSFFTIFLPEDKPGYGGGILKFLQIESSSNGLKNQQIEFSTGREKSQEECNRILRISYAWIFR